MCNGVTLKTFDELTVRLSLDSSNLQHQKLLFQLVKPHIPGFSYVVEDQIMEVDEVETLKKQTPNTDAFIKEERKRKESGGKPNKKKKSKK